MVNHKTKELYVGQVNGPKEMQKGGAESRMKSSKHPARSLLEREGTIRTIQDVSADGNWKSIAKSEGVSEGSARANMVKVMERVQLEETMAKHPEYKVLNNLDGNDLGRGIINSDKAAMYQEKYAPKRTGKVKAQIKTAEGWAGKPKFKGRGAASAGLAIGLGFMVAGELTGANDAAVAEVREKLEWYQRSPNAMTGAGLGFSIGNAFGTVDSVTLGLQNALIKAAEEKQ